MEKRTCKECKKEFPIEKFANAGIVNGKQYYRHYCKSCYYDRKNIRRKRIREEFLEYKKTLKCYRCGFADYRALEFHHLDGKEKEFTLSYASSNGYSIDRIMQEAQKCIVLCSNCHAIEHFKEVYNSQ